MTIIATKRKFYRLWRAGVLGNRPHTWPGWTELAASGWTKPVVVRSTAIGYSTVYGVPVAEAIVLGVSDPRFTFNECLPDHLLLLQGEVTRGDYGLDLTFTRVCKPMKLALAEKTEYARGLAAKVLLDHFLWPSSRDDLDDLLSLYPGHVIEFGAYDCAIGDLPHRNTLVWEVRNY